MVLTIILKERIPFRKGKRSTAHLGRKMGNRNLKAKGNLKKILRKGGQFNRKVTIMHVFCA